jgi:co-chaperonin GroES (HSP10)
VVIEPIEQEEMTAGGSFYLKPQKKNPEGHRLAIGPATAKKTEIASRWTLKSAMLCSLRNIPAQKQI